MRRLIILLCAVCLCSGLRADTSAHDRKLLGLDAIRDITHASRVCLRYCNEDETEKEALKAIAKANESLAAFRAALPEHDGSLEVFMQETMARQLEAASMQDLLALKAHDAHRTDVQDLAFLQVIDTLKMSLRLSDKTE